MGSYPGASNSAEWELQILHERASLWGRLQTCGRLPTRRTATAKPRSGPIDNRPQVGNLPHEARSRGPARTRGFAPP